MLEIDRKREITGLERVASYHRNQRVNGQEINSQSVWEGQQSHEFWMTVRTRSNAFERVQPKQKIPEP